MRWIIACYNMIPNLFWSVLCLTPVVCFCYDYLATRTLYLLLAFSLLPLFFPNRFFDLIQISRRQGFYRKLGVRWINHLSQNGAFLNHYIRKKYPAYRVISVSKASLRKQLAQTYFLERFHFSGFLFFSAITICALLNGAFVWALTICLCNLVYNIYPNLLQQYIRLKLALAKSKII